MLHVLVKRLHPSAILPTKGSIEAACFDLHVVQALSDDIGFTVHTGLSIALPKGYGMLIFPRSGLGSKLGLTLRNGTGVIDSDYRGEILLKLTRTYMGHGTEIGLALQPGSRIAQAMIIQVPEVEMLEVDELPESVRGTGGFGSTGI
jgi:dUTP pyrophosphatase